MADSTGRRVARQTWRCGRLPCTYRWADAGVLPPVGGMVGARLEGSAAKTRTPFSLRPAGRGVDLSGD